MEKLGQEEERWILQIQLKEGTHLFMHVFVICIKLNPFILPLLPSMVGILIICTILKYHRLAKRG